MNTETKDKILNFIKSEISVDEFKNFKDLLENKYDTTTEVFFDLQKNGKSYVSIIEYEDDGKLGYSIQLPNVNVWMDEELWYHVAEGILIAIDKLKQRKVRIE